MTVIVPPGHRWNDCHQIGLFSFSLMRFELITTVVVWQHVGICLGLDVIWSIITPIGIPHVGNWSINYPLSFTCLLAGERSNFSPFPLSLALWLPSPLLSPWLFLDISVHDRAVLIRIPYWVCHNLPCLILADIWPIQCQPINSQFLL